MNSTFSRLILLFYLLIGVVVLNSCKKKSLEFELTGKVSDLTFNHYLIGAKVVLEETLSGNEGEGFVYETTVKEDGTYYFKFPRNKALSYKITISKENYFTSSIVKTFSSLTTEEVNEVNLQTTAKAWVKFVFANNLPSNANDVFEFTKQEGKMNCEECCTSDKITWTGTDTVSFICVNDGNTNYSYMYTSTNPTDFGFRTVLTPAFDTVVYVHNY